MIVTKDMEYHDKNVKLNGFVAFDDAITAKRPLVLVSHDWSGCNEFAKDKAKKLAELGYVGFALDMFGGGKVFQTTEEKSAAIQPLLADRKLLAERINAAFDFAKLIEQVDVHKTAAIGFCFGGLCVLDLARSGADVTGVVTFHGLLNAPSFPNKNMQAKVLALHGHEDPMVPPDAVSAFEKEMTAAKVDWQIHVYGNTKHAFTNPAAHDLNLGLIYDKSAAKRSWVSLRDFLAEIFV